MKKSSNIKKDGFLQGAFVVTFGIVITKILGILYVIPFHSLIGDRGGALYGYAYTIYVFFLSLSSLGIPLAISRLVSEYQTLGYMDAKKRTFIIGKKIALVLGTISFLLLILFAPYIAKFILGDLSGGNSIDDVSFVIRVVATSLLVIPVLAIYRGYFEGHRYMSFPSVSQVIEQLFRIFVVIFGSYFAIKVFNLSLTTTVGIAVFGTFVGAIGAYFYLFFNERKYRKNFLKKTRIKNEAIVSNKVILKKIIIYAIPFIVIDLFKSFYNMVDMFSVVKLLVYKASYTTKNAEVIFSMLSTWSLKFNMIISSIATGVSVSLIPILTEFFVKNDMKEINKKINQSLSIILFFALPISFGISFLSHSIWTLFYGESIYGASVLSYSIFVGVVSSLLSISVSILQVFKDIKNLLITLLLGFLLKVILNLRLVGVFYSLGLPPYYGIITASIFGYLFSFVICLIILHKKYSINYESMIKNFFDILCGSIFMILVLYLIKIIVPNYSVNRLFNIIIIIFYAFIGFSSYFVYSYKCGVFKSIFGKGIVKLFSKNKKNT